jgi:hypothetical protein
MNIQDISRINLNNSLADRSLELTQPKKISAKKSKIICITTAQYLLEKNGLLDGYKYVLSNICKNGLPEGDIFEYAAYMTLNFEKKWKKQKRDEVKEKIRKYKEEKQLGKLYIVI